MLGRGEWSGSLSGAGPCSGVASSAADDRTRSMRVRMKRPDSSFPYVLAPTYAGLVTRSTPLSTAGPPPGIGPYAIGRLQPGGGFEMRHRARFSIPGVPGGNVDAILVDVVADRARAPREVHHGRPR